MNASSAEPGIPPYRPADLAEQLRSLGVPPGAILLTHTSYRAVRPVEGGPAGLIDGLLEAVGPEGTVVMPSMGCDDDAPFDSISSPADPALGVVAETFRHLRGVRRSAHAHAFAALGPMADRITADPLPIPPHGPASPVGRVHELDGWVLLLGVGHDANSTLHLAEVLADVPYGIPRHVTEVRDGKLVRIEYLENDHCCARFAAMDGWLLEAGLQTVGPVGHGKARLSRSRDLVRVATERLARDPLIFLHRADERCDECDAARSSIVPRSV